MINVFTSNSLEFTTFDFTIKIFMWSIVIYFLIKMLIYMILKRWNLFELFFLKIIIRICYFYCIYNIHKYYDQLLNVILNWLILYKIFLKKYFYYFHFSYSNFLFNIYKNLSHQDMITNKSMKPLSPFLLFLKIFSKQYKLHS